MCMQQRTTSNVSNYRCLLYTSMHTTAMLLQNTRDTPRAACMIRCPGKDFLPIWPQNASTYNPLTDSQTAPPCTCLAHTTHAPCDTRTARPFVKNAELPSRRAVQPT